MSLQQFDPPGFATDLSAPQQQGWSRQINEWIEANRQLPAPYARYFFNELHHPEATNGIEAKITWEGFPRFWQLRYPDDEEKKYEAAEKLYKSETGIYRFQDEYLEWRSEYREGRFYRIIFTCEGPEYWRYIAEVDKDLLLRLYRQYVPGDIAIEDLFVHGQYNPYNKWNTTHGIVHLTHGANTLGAEINLAARATVLRKKGTADPVTDSHDLICCSGYGNASRFSDPTIGASVNALVRQGLSVTLANPIGLYIHKLKTAGIVVPDGFAVKDFYQLIRGREGRVLRAEFRVPEGSAMSLEEVEVGGRPLRWGGQIAEMLEMVIYGKAFRLEQAIPPTQPCGNYCSDDPLVGAESGTEKAAGLRMFQPSILASHE